MKRVKIPWSRNERILSRYKRIISLIHEQTEDYLDMPDKAFSEKTSQLKERHLQGEALDDLLIEAFALVVGACKRLVGRSWIVCDEPIQWKMVPFDVQIMGAIGLYQGKIVEMATGEGKTLTATMPLFLHALHGGGIHLATVNDYLARRDSEWMGGVFQFLGLSVGCIIAGMSGLERKKNYSADITYGTGKEFGFDYLRDHAMTHTVDELVQRLEHDYILVDEVDSVLIDEARTPLIISGLPKDDGSIYARLNSDIVKLIQSQNTMIDKLLHTIESDKSETATVKNEGVKLFLAHKGSPRDQKLKAFLSNPLYFKLMRSAETYLMRDLRSRRIKEVLNEKLLFVVEEEFKQAYLTDKGMRILSREDADRFVLPDFNQQMEGPFLQEHLEQEARLEKTDEAYTQYELKRQQVHAMKNLLSAQLLYHRDGEYCVIKDQVILVDVNTGRLMHGRRLQHGLHQAIEAKENLRISPETHTIASISVQNYFKLYEQMGGMTGTASTSAKEFYDVYEKEVVVIPTHRPVRRINYPNGFFRTHQEKLNAIVEEIVSIHEMGRPILVGTTTVGKSEEISERLKARGIAYHVLNARHHEQEAVIIRDAGKKHAVTLATNMAGRGTDIQLDRDVSKWPTCSLIKIEKDGCPYMSEYQCMKRVPCGLHVIGTERHESARIDLQLIGRSARQGDPGSTRYFVSLEDQLLRLYGKGKIYHALKLLSTPAVKGFSHKVISALIRFAQDGVELMNYSLRQRLLEYDDVLSLHASIIYEYRDRFLSSDNIVEYITMLEKEDPALFGGLSERYNAKVLREGVWFRIEERLVFINQLDQLWIQHIEDLERLWEGMGMRAVGARPGLLAEFKKEAFRLFQHFMMEFKNTVVQQLF